MARIRSIKPTFWTDPDLGACRRDARLLTIGLMSAADDYGRFIASPAAIAGAVFPFDNIAHTTIRRWLTEISKAGTIQLYTVDGQAYGCFPKWRLHQRVDKPYPSQLPPPPGWHEDAES